MPSWDDPITWGEFVYAPLTVLAGVLIGFAILHYGPLFFDWLRFRDRHCDRPPLCGFTEKPEDMDCLVDHCSCLCNPCRKARGVKDAR